MYIFLGLLRMKSLEASDTGVGNAALCHLSGEELQHMWTFVECMVSGWMVYALLPFLIASYSIGLKKNNFKISTLFFYIFYLFIELVGKQKRSMMAFTFTFYCSTCDDDYIRINKFLFPRLELALKEKKNFWY